MTFSSGLTLTDLSDYLAPSQICIKPATLVEDESVPTPTPIEAEITRKATGFAVTEISIDSEQGYYEAGADGLGKNGKKLKKAEITIEDCLACSGCVTSAESVLVAMQSDEEVFRALAERPDLTPILSIAPQSLASLATLHGLTLEETLRGLRRFFKEELGFRLVFDTTFALSLSLAENRLEFLERRSSSSLGSSSSAGPLPILTSECPGWICYAEKTHGDLLPFVSKVKSGMSIMGTLVKMGPVAKVLNLRPQDIYHVSVMPCFDKKLEASRPDFTTPYLEDLSFPSTSTEAAVRDVDCVLTTGEVQKMLDSKGLSLARLASELPPSSSSAHVSLPEEDALFPSLLNAPGSSSGGFLYNTIQAVLETIPSEDLYTTKLVERKVRNEDHVAYTLYSTPSSPALNPTIHLRAAKCYGFTQLTNLTRKVSSDAGILPTSSVDKMLAARQKRAAAKAKSARIALGTGVDLEVTVPGGEGAYDYVEVMACPSGCVNGGGQIKVPSDPIARRIKRLRESDGSNSSQESNGRFDAEGMPDLSERMDVDDAEAEGEKVLNGKEWVGRMEEVYWEDGGGFSREGQDRIVDGIDWARIDASIKPYLLGIRSVGKESRLEQLRSRVVDDLVGSSGTSEERSDRRMTLLRTSYRAVEKEVGNGLAVVW